MIGKIVSQKEKIVLIAQKLATGEIENTTKEKVPVSVFLTLTGSAIAVQNEKTMDCFVLTLDEIVNLAIKANLFEKSEVKSNG